MDPKQHFDKFKQCASCIYCEDLSEEGYRKCTRPGKNYIEKVPAHCSEYLHDPKYTETDMHGKYIGGASAFSQTTAVAPQKKNPLIIVIAVLIAALIVSGVVIGVLLSKGDRDDSKPRNREKKTTERTNVEETNIPATEEETHSPLTVTVSDAVNYEKHVVAMSGYSISDLSPDFRMHYVMLPQISLATDNASAFNTKLLNPGFSSQEILNTLKNNEEGQLIMQISYDSYVDENKTVAILITSSTAYQFSEVYTGYQGYYFDVENDKEILFDEYLSSYNLSRADILSHILKDTGFTNTFDTSSFNESSIVCAVFKDISTVIVLKTEGMDGDFYFSYEFAPII